MKYKKYSVKKVTRQNTKTGLAEFQIQVIRSFSSITDYPTLGTSHQKIIWISKRYDNTEAGSKACEIIYNQCQNAVIDTNSGFFTQDNLLKILDN